MWFGSTSLQSAVSSHSCSHVVIGSSLPQHAVGGVGSQWCNRLLHGPEGGCAYDETHRLDGYGGVGHGVLKTLVVSAGLTNVTVFTQRSGRSILENCRRLGGHNEGRGPYPVGQGNLAPCAATQLFIHRRLEDGLPILYLLGS